MATVTGYTSAKMDLIANATITGASVVGDDLILATVGNGNINAGNVRGPQGIQGATGPQGPALPTGTFIMGGWSGDPVGFLILDGRTVTNGATTYSALAALFPSWVSGNNLVLPDASGSVPMVGATPGIVSGSMSKSIAITNMPTHLHTQPTHQHTGPNHQHPFTTSTVSGTGFDVVRRYGSYGSGGDYGIALDSNGDGVNNPQATGPASAGTAHYHDFGNTGVMSVGNGGNPTHNHTGTTDAAGTGVTGAAGGENTGYTGDGNPLDVTPKNLTVKIAVKT